MRGQTGRSRIYNLLKKGTILGKKLGNVPSSPGFSPSPGFSTTVRAVRQSAGSNTDAWRALRELRVSIPFQHPTSLRNRVRRHQKPAGWWEAHRAGSRKGFLSGEPLSLFDARLPVHPFRAWKYPGRQRPAEVAW